MELKGRIGLVGIMGSTIGKGGKLVGGLGQIGIIQLGPKLALLGIRVFIPLNSGQWIRNRKVIRRAPWAGSLTVASKRF